MHITDDDIRRFQEIWREEFTEEITVDEAREHIARLDAIYLFLARRPTPLTDSLPSRSEEIQHQ